MEEERCWVCGSKMIQHKVIRNQGGGWIIIQCNSCLEELIAKPIGIVKKGVRRLPGTDGFAGV